MRWVRSARGDLRYVAWGDDYRSLVPILDYLTGPRRLVETALARSGLSRSRSRRDIPPEAADRLDDLRRRLGDRASGFLLYTGYYKTTWFVGPVLTDPSAPLFLKLFKDAQEAGAEIDRSKAVRGMPGVGHGFDVLTGDLFMPAVTAYRPVRRSRVATVQDALDVGSAIARGTGVGTPTSASSWHLRAVAADRVSRARGLSREHALSRHLTATTPCSPSHGDVTPWNIVPTTSTLTLVDYERVGTRPDHFDLVYAATHPAALAAKPHALGCVHNALAAAGLPRTRSVQVVRAALSASIIEAVEDLELHPGNVDRVSTVIRRKYAFLEAT